MKILVTGPSGVIGAGVVPGLLSAGHTLRLLSRHADRFAKILPRHVEAWATDITDEEQLYAAAAGCDCVIHIAGIVEEEPPEITFDRVNVGGMRLMLEASIAAGRPGFVYISSLGADAGESEYHASKRRAEALLRSYGGPWVVLRPGNVYGPGDETISLLLKMVRTLPAVPMVEHGNQPFQPIWYEDLARAIVHVTTDVRRYDGRVFELAGEEITTTNDLIERFSHLVERQPARLPVTAWLARFGTQTLEAFGSSGQALLRRAGLTPPLNSAKLSMLLEGNVISDPRKNALTTELGIEPTALADGLEMLIDGQAEQLPGSGIGALKHSRYFARIENSRYSAGELLDLVCDRITEVMPIDFAVESGTPTSAHVGETLTANIPGRGHVQVRLEEKTPRRATFATLESHPLAGIVRLEADDTGDGVKFEIHTVAQPANVFDWLALKLVGEFFQRRNWRNVVRRVVELSGGTARGGVHDQTDTLDDEAARELRVRVEKLIEQRKRSEMAQQIRVNQPEAEPHLS